MINFALKLLLGALFLANVSFLYTTPAHSRERYYQTTEEYIGGTLAHTADVATDVAVNNTKAALEFCQRIGRDTTADDVNFSSDTRFDNRTTSDNGRGYYHYFSPLVEKRIDASVTVYSNARFTCGTKK